MDEFLAHYDENGMQQSLKDHITGVMHLAMTEGAKIGIGHMVQVIAMTHDMGKYSEEFQDYLRRGRIAEEKGRVNHTSAGAEILYGCLPRKSGNEDLAVFRETLCYVVTAHHGLYDMVNREDEDTFAERLKKIDQPLLQTVYTRWSDEMQISMAKLQECLKLAFEEYRNAFVNRFKDIRGQDREEYLFYIGCLTRLLLSIQIDADWSDTAQTMSPGVPDDMPEAGELYGQAWKNYMQYIMSLTKKAEKETANNKAKEVNQIREQIRQECMEFTRHGPGIHCLSIPTGAGKTLTSLGYALKYAKEQAQGGKPPEHIIYISPFISITEQNAQVIREAIGVEEWILEHHSNVSNSDERKTDIDPCWDEPFICTTMVQFLQTLFSDKKKSIRRFHRLKRSVIILDEVQSLPVKTIHTFNLMTNFLAEVCQANIVLCTATQPNLDSEFVKRKLRYARPRDMIADLSGKFARFERVQIKCLSDTYQGMSKETMESLTERVSGELREAHSLLVILNKKQTVAEFYERIKEMLPEVQTYYLTTNLCAEHRRDRIAQIREGLKRRDHKILIVSTNLIEAGVDLSVERVYRSLAGIDSIAQAAGRCNRNGELACGTVHVFELEGDEPGKRMDELLIAQETTKEIVYRHLKSQAKESILFPEWMRQYYEAFYEEVKAKMDFPLYGECKGESIFGLMSKGFSEVQAPHMMRQAFQTAGRLYEVIADTGVTVVVPYRTGIKLIAELEEGDCQRPQAIKIRTCLRRLQPYTVSVYHYKKEELLQKGVIRESNVLPGVYIAVGYEDEMGLVNMLPEAIF